MGMNERDYAIMLQAIQTIHRRSKGLLDFVENYRKLTRIPTPTMQIFPISVLFSDLQKLVRLTVYTLSIPSARQNYGCMQTGA